MRRRSIILGLALAPFLAHQAAGQDAGPRASAADAPAPFVVPTQPPAPAGPAPLPINLATALHLAGSRPLDVALASRRVQAAAAEESRARVLWLPNITLGADYYRHDGQIQDIVGNVFTTSRSTFLVGANPTAVFAVSDALFAPLAARQVTGARLAAEQAARNDALLAVAEAFFGVQQARGELAGALDTLARTEELTRRAERLAPGTIPALEVSRVRAERARRRQAVHSARERWQVSSAELARLLRLTPGAVVEPLEPAHLRVALVEPERALDDLIPLALTSRPELAGHQALVEATLARLKHERLRPLIPSVLLRGASTNPAGTLGAGYFGGGINSHVSNFGGRSDFDVQVLWEVQNLGLGNRARVAERRAENQIALLELFRTQDRVAAEVTQAHAQLASASLRSADATDGLVDAVDSARRNLDGVGQTRRAGEIVLPVIRPQEAVASVQALYQAYNDYFGAVADFNRAQFRLYRALGQPAQRLTAEGACPEAGQVLPPAPPLPGQAPPTIPPPLPILSATTPANR